MTAFNTLNGVPATGNRFLLRQILRDEWKYDGSGGERLRSRHGNDPPRLRRDARDAARKAANAGVDMEMVEHRVLRSPEVAGGSGRGAHREIDDAVRNILRLKFRLGLFDQSIPAPAEHDPRCRSPGTRERPPSKARSC